MLKVRFTHNIFFRGKTYVKDQEYDIDDETYKILKNYIIAVVPTEPVKTVENTETASQDTTEDAVEKTIQEDKGLPKPPKDKMIKKTKNKR